MIVGFVCLDGEKIKLEDCFAKCRMGRRCATLPTLVKMSQERVWAGKPSTTQLLNGTMMEFLKLEKPYYIVPDRRAFMIQGTRHHEELEAVAKRLGLPSEVALSVDRDIFDLIEPEEDGLVLTDYKLWGSFKVAKVLGMTLIGKKPNPNGEVYKTSGKWGVAGSVKMVNAFEEVADNIDNWEAEAQLNNYKIKLKKLGITIARLQLQVTVKDGGIAVAESRGITRNLYVIPVRILDEVMLTDYFEHKEFDLLTAMTRGSWSVPCSPKECWDGRRCCPEFCEVWEHCP